jgi:hypothetical protein
MSEQQPEQREQKSGEPDVDAGPSPYPENGEQAAGEDQAEQNAAEEPPA